MPKNPPHSGFALSPTPRGESTSPDDEVMAIVDTLVTSTYLNPVVAKFLEDPGLRELFIESFARQANLIKSRCQSFDDCHVTVYDKVLLRLTDNGNRFDMAAAQEYFCEEFLGISKNGDPAEAERTLASNVALKAILARAAYPQGKYGEKYSAETKYGEKGQLPAPSSISEGQKDEAVAKVARLTSLYEKAKADFDTVPPENTVGKLESAKFLRDTAENAIMYLRDLSNSGSDAGVSLEYLEDLQQTCKAAQASVVSLSGGRKRKFDKHDYDPEGTAGEKPSRRGDPSTRPGGRRGRGGGRGGRGRGGRRRHELNSGPNYSTDMFARPPPSTERSPSLGYRRAVDSYQPRAGEGMGPGESHPHRYPRTQYGGYESDRQEQGYGGSGMGYGGSAGGDYGQAFGGSYPRGGIGGWHGPERRY